MVGGVGRLKLWVLRPGCVPYDEAVALQESLREARLADRIPDILLLLEHPPVVTTGRAARPEHVLYTEEELAAAGVALREAGRGGDVTYHGPGQLVGYPILHLGQHGRDVHRYLRLLEESLIRCLAGYDLEAGRIQGLTGVWVGDRKIAAIGVGIRHWITWHGFALNVDPDLGHFDLIVPCGIRDHGVTSLACLLPECPAVNEVADRVVESFSSVFGLEAVEVGASALDASR